MINKTEEFGYTVSRDVKNVAVVSWRDRTLPEYFKINYLQDFESYTVDGSFPNYKLDKTAKK